EVRQAHLEVETTQQQVAVYRDRMLPSAEEGYQVVRRRYDEGGASYLEVIDAGRTLAETRTTWVEVLLGYYEAMAELKRAVGGRIGNEN
ncbi:MAG: TolC family protein, partial [Candidatus Latescibacteria bacterium]|nr:TolC family protein [Candidatus Latescibacterota bacterium]